MITVSPPETSVRNGPMPTTAGMPSASATIAVWLPGPPISVTKPRDELRIEIGRFAGREVVGQHEHFGDVMCASSSRRLPNRCRSSRFSMSKMSFARSGMYSPSSDWNDLGVVPQRAAHRVLGRVVPLADHLLQLRRRAAVVEHLDVGGEDRRVLVAELLGDAIAIALDLGGGGGDGADRAARARLRRRRAAGTAEGCEIPRCP